MRLLRRRGRLDALDVVAADTRSLRGDLLLRVACRLPQLAQSGGSATSLRSGAADFRDTQFGYRIGEDVEQFVATRELQSPDTISLDPWPPGQVWGLSEAGGEVGPGLYRIEVKEAPGGGVRLVNQAAPAALRESVKLVKQNLVSGARGLVGDRDPREHELTARVRALDAAKSGAGLAMPILLAMAGALLQRPLRGGLVVVGNLTLGGGVETLLNPAALAELAMEKGASALLLPVSSRRALVDVSDEVATKVAFVHYTDARDALLKALDE